MKKIRSTAFILLTFSALIGYVQQAAADDLICEDLVGVRLAATRIESAAWVGAGLDEVTNVSFPKYCLVRGIIKERTGMAGVPFGAKFELRLPTNWNSRFYFQGGGGLDGSVRPAIGSGQPSGQLPALVSGYAVVSTDAGHEDKDGSFGLDEQARIDWGYQAVEDVTITAKEIIKKFYNRAPEYSYLVGCSNGGRQAMVASQRFPEMFDGLVAGAPVFRMSRSHIDTAWGLQKLTSIAPKDSNNAPILSRAFSAAELDAVAEDILVACDANDGLKDGVIQPNGSCKYDPARLACDGVKVDACLSGDQVAALKDVFSGSVNSQGEAYYTTWPWDTGIASDDWRRWRLGTSETAVPNAIKAGLSNNGIKHVFITPADPVFDIQKFDFDSDPKRMEASAAFADAVSTNLGEFKAHGGKILFYHGMSDPAISANDTIRYFDDLTKANGGSDATQDFARLFLAPGMGHCRGGGGLDQFDVLTAIVDWVENDIVPEKLIASGGTFADRTRPLCPYPTVATFSGIGNIDDERSFTCK